MVTIELGFRKIWANEVDAVTTKTWVEGRISGLNILA
jgi:hypothetical protein